jgi:uncharacterized protein YqjF (DUF2071 family)
MVALASGLLAPLGAMIDRLSIRTRPPGSPLGYQTWGKLLFLHWPIPVERLRPLIPARLEIDTCDGMAWIGVTPFTFWGSRPALLPALPVIGASHELNVRTYVHLDGVPGVWFFSLDASNPLAVLGARLGFALPYFQAGMTLEEQGPTIHFTSRRTHLGAPSADFEAIWTGGDPIPELQPATRDFFLIERYCLYTESGSTLYRARIFHDPWPLRHATLSRLSSTMIESHGLPTPAGDPLLHFQAAPLEVGIWPIEKV